MGSPIPYTLPVRATTIFLQACEKTPGRVERYVQETHAAFGWDLFTAVYKKIMGESPSVPARDVTFHTEKGSAHKITFASHILPVAISPVSERFEGTRRLQELVVYRRDLLNTSLRNMYEGLWEKQKAFLESGKVSDLKPITPSELSDMLDLPPIDAYLIRKNRLVSCHTTSYKFGMPLSMLTPYRQHAALTLLGKYNDLLIRESRAVNRTGKLRDTMPDHVIAANLSVRPTRVKGHRAWVGLPSHKERLRGYRNGIVGYRVSVHPNEFTEKWQPQTFAILRHEDRRVPLTDVH